MSDTTKDTFCTTQNKVCGVLLQLQYQTRLLKYFSYRPLIKNGCMVYMVL